MLGDIINRGVANQIKMSGRPPATRVVAIAINDHKIFPFELRRKVDGLQHDISHIDIR